MTARQIKKLRKRIGSKGYYEQRLRNAAERVAKWHTFETFDCSSNFRGYELARHNREVYNRYYPKAVVELNWYRKKCGYDGRIEQ